MVIDTTTLFQTAEKLLDCAHGELHSVFTGESMPPTGDELAAALKLVTMCRQIDQSIGDLAATLFPDRPFKDHAEMTAALFELPA